MFVIPDVRCNRVKGYLREYARGYTTHAVDRQAQGDDMKVFICDYF
jgi:hypothetical protein